MLLLWAQITPYAWRGALCLLKANYLPAPQPTPCFKNFPNSPTEMSLSLLHIPIAPNLQMGHFLMSNSCQGYSTGWAPSFLHFQVWEVGGEAEVSHLFYLLQRWLRKQTFRILF